jgi:T-complex protein 1 subunit epsilon
MVSCERTILRSSTNLFLDMRQHFVIDPLIGKRQQLLLATQLCRMVLKVNNVIIAGSDENEF